VEVALEVAVLSPRAAERAAVERRAAAAPRRPELRSRASPSGAL